MIGTVGGEAPGDTERSTLPDGPSPGSVLEISAFPNGGNGRAGAASPYHHFTVDVEEYFHVSALESAVPRRSWERLESRIGRALPVLLDLLNEREVTGTFFVLGWLARRRPDVVKRISADGHEVASHGWGHRRIPDLTQGAFRESVRSTRRLLQDLTGRAVEGYRAPSFSIVQGREWALDVLIEEGYRYDSSLFPIRRPGYGHPHGPTAPAWIHRPAGRILEFPPTVLTMGGVRVPAAGGGYFRHLPYSMFRSAFSRQERRGEPGTFYIHPWELDPGQPRIPVGLSTHLRHYGGLARTRARLDRLFSEFSFGPIARTLERSREMVPV